MAAKKRVPKRAWLVFDRVSGFFDPEVYTSKAVATKEANEGRRRYGEDTYVLAATLRHGAAKDGK